MEGKQKIPCFAEREAEIIYFKILFFIIRLNLNLFYFVFTLTRVSKTFYQKFDAIKMRNFLCMHIRAFQGNRGGGGVAAGHGLPLRLVYTSNFL